MSKILGIDLGTTNSAMAIVEGGEPKILENDEGGRTTPSVVAITKANERVTGLLAKRQAITNPKNTIFSSKRLIGRKFKDEEVQKDKNLLAYEMQEAKNGGIEIKMGDLPDGKAGKWHMPAEISAMILQKLKKDAEARIGEKIEEAIITVPAYFNDSQRKATKDAGEIAGFKVKRILNEPTAAALAYGFNKRKNEQIVVYDFGGGTFDVSVLEVGDDVIEVKSTNGDTHLGGDDLDQKIIDWIISEFKKESGIDVSKDQLALQRLKESAEKAKHELSSTLETEINIPFITSNESGPQHLLLKFSRSKLEELISDFIDRSIKITEDAVKDAGFKNSDIDEIILVGGQTRMPAIQEAVKKLFNKEPNKSINPDEVVATGAAIQAGILQGDVKDVLLLDVTPLSLGIETMGGVMTKIIEKNTTIPVSRSQVFSTAQDNQNSVEVHILQGERGMANDNRTLGRFILDEIPPAPRGVPQVEVALDIDANGILSVTAKDKATNREQSIRIEASSDLSKEEVEKMKQEAQTHTEEDTKKKEIIEVRNSADSLIYTSEKSLKDAGDKVSEEIKKAVQEKVEALKKIKDSDNIEDIKSKTEELSQELQKIGAEMYKQAPKTDQPDSSPENKEDNVQDADFKEVKDENKENKEEDKKENE